MKMTGALRYRTIVGLVLASVIMVAPAAAQQIKKHNTYGTPLDTLKSTRFKTDVPEAEDFVKETRPDKSSLNYTPLTGVDPERPKPRDAKGVEALQAELEKAGARNEQHARGLLPKKKPAATVQTARGASPR
jgi:hypothetical protein